MKYEQIDKAFEEWSNDKTNNNTCAVLEFTENDVKSARAIFTDGFMACLEILGIKVE